MFIFTGIPSIKTAGQIGRSPIYPICRKRGLNQLVKLIGSSNSSVTRAAIWLRSLLVKVI